jgi:DNA-binding response OmpR family regulator
VLIVDDDRAALERDFRVFRATDTAAATHVLDRETIDLIILDVLLDKEGGLDFLARLREESDVPVLLISGYGTKETVIEGLRFHASDYPDKPFTTTQLLEKAREFLLQDSCPSHISERIQHFIEQHYTQDWTVESLAKVLNLSVRTMRQMFRRRYQQSVMDFLEEARITRAGDLLATTDLRPTAGPPGLLPAADPLAGRAGRGVC